MDLTKNNFLIIICMNIASSSIDVNGCVQIENKLPIIDSKVTGGESVRKKTGECKNRVLRLIS